MSLWKTVQDTSVIGRARDEALHAAALQELRSGRRRDGLWAKALIEAKGESAHTEAVYLRLLVVALRDEMYISSRAVAQKADDLSLDVYRGRTKISVFSELALRRRATFPQIEVLVNFAGGSIQTKGIFNNYYLVSYQRKVNKVGSFEDLGFWVAEMLPLQAWAGE